MIASNVFAQFEPVAISQLNVINATENYTLYFNTVTKKSTCYPEIKEYNPNAPSGYCILTAGNAISFNNYLELESYYPNLQVFRQNQILEPIFETSPSAASTNLGVLQMDWAKIIYKVTNTATGHTEGVHIGFSDFSSCHNLSSSFGVYGTTETESFTTFSVGGDRYFVVGEY